MWFMQMAPTEIRGRPPVKYTGLPAELPVHFRQVLDDAQDEKPLQEFFEKNPAALLTGILRPHRAWVLPRQILPKPEGGFWVPDFMICDWTSVGPQWLIVELESPTGKPTNTKGISAKLRDAQQQIEDYRGHLQRNAALLRDGGFPGIQGNVPAWILIGRRGTRSTVEQNRLANLRQYNIEVATYDRVLYEFQERVSAEQRTRRELEMLRRSGRGGA